MKHLDEGTIHAWLDGALSDDEARYCEEHAAQCEACRAAVAEARGLVAGASRILSALDDVPAGVVPARTARPETRRNWTRTLSWAMAATVVLAVGVKVATRTPADRIATVRAAPMRPAVAESAAAKTVAKPPAPAPAPAPAPTPAPAPAQAKPESEPAAPRTIERDVAAANAPEQVKAADATAAPRAQASRVERGVAGGMARPAMPVLNGVVVTGLASAERDTGAALRIPVCYTNGVEHLTLDTADVGGDMPGWRVLRDEKRVAGRWRLWPNDSITLIMTQPMQRMLVGVVRAGGLDLKEMGSSAGVWMGRAECRP